MGRIGKPVSVDNAAEILKDLKAHYGFGDSLPLPSPEILNVSSTLRRFIFAASILNRIEGNMVNLADLPVAKRGRKPVPKFIDMIVAAVDAMDWDNCVKLVSDYKAKVAAEADSETHNEGDTVAEAT